MKITNNRERPAGNVSCSSSLTACCFRMVSCCVHVRSLQILLHSMHKYFLRLVVEEEHRPAPGERKGPSKTILSTDFPETTFIAVTAYQNEEAGFSRTYQGSVYSEVGLMHAANHFVLLDETLSCTKPWSRSIVRKFQAHREGPGGTGDTSTGRAPKLLRGPMRPLFS